MSEVSEFLTKRTKIKIPFCLFGPLKAKDPQLNVNGIEIKRGFKITQPRVAFLKGNNQDKVINSDTIAFFEEDSLPGATLVILPREEVKSMMLNPVGAPRDACNLAIIKNDCTLIPGFLPDFALLPKVLKIVLKWMFMSSEYTPPLLRRLWLAASPSLPTTRHETELSYSLVRFRCFSFTSRLHLFEVPYPSKKDITIEAECSDLSSDPMDGRRYLVELYARDKANKRCTTEQCQGGTYELINRPNVHVLVWNCQGMGRTSFKGHLEHLIRAHKPDVIVLLETRMSRHMLRPLLRDTVLWRVVGMSPTHIYGGIAIISCHNKVQFVLHQQSQGRIMGCLKGEKLMYFGNDHRDDSEFL